MIYSLYNDFLFFGETSVQTACLLVKMNLGKRLFMTHAKTVQKRCGACSKAKATQQMWIMSKSVMELSDSWIKINWSSCNPTEHSITHIKTSIPLNKWTLRAPPSTTPRSTKFQRNAKCNIIGQMHFVTIDKTSIRDFMAFSLLSFYVDVAWR